jgi:hypothetical protein
MMMKNIHPKRMIIENTILEFKAIFGRYILGLIINPSVRKALKT